MGIFDRFPYASTHEMNLDFMLGKAQEINAQLTEVQNGLTTIDEKTTRAETAADTAESAAQQATEKAEEAEQSARDSAIWAVNAEEQVSKIGNATTICENAAVRAESAATRAESAATDVDQAVQAAETAEQAAFSAAASEENVETIEQRINLSQSAATAAANTATAAANQANTAAGNAATSATNAATAATSIIGIKEHIDEVAATIPSDYYDFHNAFAHSQVYDVRKFNDAICVNINADIEQGAFSSINPDVQSDFSLRTVEYISGDLYILNPNERLAYAIMEFTIDGSYVRYVQGLVPSNTTNFFRDEVLYIPEPTTPGGKYRVRITYDVSGGKNIIPADNTISFYKPYDSIAEHITIDFEQGAFTSTNPDVTNTMSLRTIDYFKGGVYIVNPNGRLAWALMKFPDAYPESGSGAYVAGSVPSTSNNFYRDELFYVPADEGYKYRLRVTFDASKLISTEENTISFTKSLTTKTEHYAYKRNYTDITGLLTFENKSIGASSGITESNTRLIAKLPNVGNVEVRMNTPNCRFAIFREDTSGTTPVYTALTPGTWTWFFYRYTGDPAYNYYVLTRYETESAITPNMGGMNVKVYTYEDTGELYNNINPLYGKTIAVFGDSIVQGRFRKNNADHTNALMPKPYAVLISEMSNTEPGDYGIGGANVYGNSWNTLYTRRQAVQGYDIVLVHAGTNDFGDSIPESDFKSAYTSVLTTLKANNKKIYVVTPAVKATNNINTIGHKLSDYAQWAKDVANANNVDIIDLYTLTAKNHIYKLNLPDNIHPNETGHKIIADLILDNINY